MNEHPRPSPPRFAAWLLRLRPLGERRRDVTADLAELFEQRLAEPDRRYARRRYYHDVLSVLLATPVRDRPAISITNQRWPAGSWRDLVYAVRMYRRQPAPVIIAVLGLGASLAVCGSVFSVVQASIFNGNGVEDPSTLARVLKVRDNDTSNTVPYDDYLRLREAAQQISLDAYVQDQAQLDEQASGFSRESAGVTFVTGNFFSDLGGRAHRGRLFGEPESQPSSPGVVVLSYTFWKKRFRSDESVVGRTIWLSGSPFTIVGVTTESFTGPSSSAPAFWAPLGVYGHAFRARGAYSVGTRLPVQVVGRLAAGTTRELAAQELTTLLHGVAAETGTSDKQHGVRLVGVYENIGGARADALGAVILTFAVVGLTLLLASANVASLLLASAAARERELKLRLALGANRWRLVRQLLTESLLLALTGGAIGLVLTIWAVPVLSNAVQLPMTVDASPDARVFAFLAMLSVVVGIGAGVAPALRGTGAALLRLRSDAGRPVVRATGHRFRSVLLGVQTGASLLVLTLAMLMGKAAVRAAVVETGFDADRLITIETGFGGGRYGDAEVSDYWASARARLATLPMVERTALTLHPPFSGGSIVQTGKLGGRPYTIFYNYTTPEYFETTGLRLVRGRVFTPDEVRTGARVAVISQRLALNHWPPVESEDPASSLDEAVGSTLDRVHTDMAGIQVIGVVSDAFTARLREYQAAALYRPLPRTMKGLGEPQLVVRTVRPHPDVQPVLDVMRAVDPELRPTGKLIADGLADERREPATIAMLAGIAAVLAVTLSLVGLIGATLQHVGQRTHEIGVRLAIGASAGTVLRLLLKDALRPIAIGLACGLALTVAGGRAIGSAMFGVSPTDASSIGLALAVLSGGALLAVFFPTRRASRTDPAKVLRES